MPHAALRARDAGADVLGAPLPRLVREMRIRNQGAGHADDVGGPLGDEPLCERRRIDASGTDDRQ